MNAEPENSTRSEKIYDPAAGLGLARGRNMLSYARTKTALTLLASILVFLGDDDYFSPGDITFLFYQEGCADLQLDSDYTIIHHAKNITCGTHGDYVDSGPHDLCQEPQLSGPFSGHVYGMIPLAGSPAIDAGDNAVCPATDYRGIARPLDGDEDGNPICDMGAYEQ